MRSKAFRLQQRVIKDIVFKGLLLVLSFLLMVPLAFILFYVIKNGIGVFSWDFFTRLPAPVGEPGGGVGNAIVGTLILMGIAAAIAIPIGILVGVYLSENPKLKRSQLISLSIDTMQGIPSIVFGIIAYVWIVVPMGGFSAISGGVALALIMLPVVVRSTEETLKMIPSTLKEASFALGGSYYITMIKIIIPSGLGGILSGILIGLARVSGETAPLLFTAFGNPFWNVNVFKSVNSLPLLIFNYATSPYQEWQELAWGASLLLIILVLLLSILSKVVVNR